MVFAAMLVLLVMSMICYYLNIAYNLC